MYDELKCITIEKPYKGFQNNGLPREQITLDKLYKDGWWITEIFGSKAFIVKRTYTSYTKKHYPRFIILLKSIDTTNATPKALHLIEKIKKKNWETYEQYMLYGVWNPKIKD